MRQINLTHAFNERRSRRKRAERCEEQRDQPTGS
jgi:hypothetical protein